MRFPTTLAALASLVAVPAISVAQNAIPDAAPAAAQAGSVKVAAKKAPSKSRTVKKPAKPAKKLFGAMKAPAALAARSIGFYARGCLAGASEMPTDGPAWQAMRLSRNRNWGHPDLVALVKKLAVEAKKYDGWRGLLVGDISQPRGGPMLTGHVSHQIGLDADIWFTPMPDRRLTTKEREQISAVSMLGDDKVSVNPKVWTDAHLKLLKRVASYKQVERVLVNPAIKKTVCTSDLAKGPDREWVKKIRAVGGHHYHFHIRMGCPKGSVGCQSQAAVVNDGCGPDLDAWLERIKNPPKRAPGPPRRPRRPKPPMTLAQLPAACRTVLSAEPPPPVASRKDLKQAGAAAKKATK